VATAHSRCGSARVRSLSAVLHRPRARQAPGHLLLGMLRQRGALRTDFGGNGSAGVIRRYRLQKQEL
jgi:hypothetical protein